MQYELYYQDLWIGSVERTPTEWPWVAGDFTLNPQLLDDPSEVAQRILAFRDLTMEEERLSEQLAQPDLSEELATAYSQAIDAIYGREEAEFSNLIESPDWYLLDPTSQERIAIVCPSFNQDKTISWR